MFSRERSLYLACNVHAYAYKYSYVAPRCSPNVKTHFIFKLESTHIRELFFFFYEPFPLLAAFTVDAVARQ